MEDSTLPFLKEKGASVASAIIEARHTKLNDEGENPQLGATERLLAAIEAKDAKGAMDALKALFHHFDSEPHSEGEHT